MKKFDCIILGGGPAGITAAIYCARTNLNVCIVDKGLIGGNPLNYLEIENYPGFGKTTTEELVDKFLEHLSLFPNITLYEFQTIENVDLENLTVKTDEETLEGNAIIIATGSKPRQLGVKGEEGYIGKGVHYCAICDGPLYKGKKVAVIGGGNSACEEALGLSKICDEVEIIEFTDKLNADKTTVDKIYNSKNIGVSLNCQVEEISGDKKVNKILFRHRDTDVVSSFDIDGVFPYIGMTPNIPEMKEGNEQLFYDEFGYIKVDEDMKTSIEGVYAIGDVTSKKYRQVATSIGDGAIAGIVVGRYCNDLKEVK